MHWRRTRTGCAEATDRLEVAGKLRNAGRGCVAAGDAGRNRILYEADFGCINSAMRLHHEALAEICMIVPIVPMPSYIIPDSCLDPNVTVCTSVRNSAQLRQISKQNQIRAMFLSLSCQNITDFSEFCGLIYQRF